MPMQWMPTHSVFSGTSWSSTSSADASHARRASPNEEMVMNLQRSCPPEMRARKHACARLVFGSTPESALALRPSAGRRQSARPEPIRPSWSIRKYSQLAAAALIVVLVGALVGRSECGIFGYRGGNDAPTAIPAAVAQVDATPAALGTPTVDGNSILWTLPFEGTNVEIGGTALSDGTLYRLIRSDEFTGVQAVDTATGTEKWRSEQEVARQRPGRKRERCLLAHRGRRYGARPAKRRSALEQRHADRSMVDGRC